MINILIADDHNVFMEGIESLLTNSQGLRVTGRCCDTQQVKDALPNLEVNVVLLDISFPKVENGMSLCCYIAENYPAVKIIALTMHDESSIVKRILRKGAHGYLLKNTSKSELVEAIRTVYEGKLYTSHFIQEVINANDSKSRGKSMYADQEITLTRRELEVLFLISEGNTTHQIADKLFVTQKAVEFHRSSLLGKFDVSNTALLIKTAMEGNYL